MHMRTAFAAAFALAIPIAAQTVATERPVAKATDKLWKIEATGLTG
jgi:hypothetical protein